MISVIMPVFNADQYLHDSIQSILNQTFSDFEYIIINDGSTDNSLNIIKEYKDKDNRIKIVNQTNMGVTKALINGINNSSRRFIARMDSDDISSKNRFEEQIKWLIDYNFDLCCSRTYWLSRKKPSSIWYCVVPFKISIRFTNPFIHGTYIFKKKLYDEIGGYNPKFSFSQDYFFMQNVIQKKYKIKYLKKILYKSRELNNSVSSKNRSNQKALIGMNE